MRITFERKIKQEFRLKRDKNYKTAPKAGMEPKWITSSDHELQDVMLVNVWECWKNIRVVQHADGWIYANLKPYTLAEKQTREGQWERRKKRQHTSFIEIWRPYGEQELSTAKWNSPQERSRDPWAKKRCWHDEKHEIEQMEELQNLSWCHCHQRSGCWALRPIVIIYTWPHWACVTDEKPAKNCIEALSKISPICARCWLAICKID